MEYLKSQNKHQIISNMKIIFGLFVLGFILLPSTTLAATIHFYSETENIYQGDIFIVETKISSSDKLINAAEGTIFFDKERLEVKELSSGGSLFSVWLSPPVFSNKEGEISFIGGTPDGFHGEDALVLKIIFLAKNDGEAKLDFQDNTTLFLHDGKGTQINPWLRPFSLNILKRPAEIPAKDEWQVLIESDKNPPEPFEIAIGRDPSIFDNQYFISFFTTDKESGIDYYEIQEGTRPYIIGDSPYLLKDQKLRSIIRVKAIDKAGNERIIEMPATYPPLPFYKTLVFWIINVIVSVVIIIFSWFVIQRIKKKKIESG